MQPAGLITSTLGVVHQAHSAAAFMPPTSGPIIPTVGAAACPVLALPNATMHDRLQSHYAASTSLSRLHNGLHLPSNGVTTSAYAAHIPGAPWPPVPPVVQAPQPTSNPPVAPLVPPPPPPITPTPQQHLLPQLFWQSHNDLSSALPPSVPGPSIPLPPSASSNVLPGDVLAGFCRRLERNKEELALEDSKYLIAERDLQEATAVLRRAEQLPKLQAKVWSFLDENDVIHRELSLLQLTAVLKGAPLTQVENSATGESLPFMDAIAATPLRNCVLERNAMRERVVVLEATICKLLAEGRAISLEVKAAEFAALADRLAFARWLPAAAATPVLHDGGGLTPQAVRMQLIAGNLAPDDLLLPAAMAGSQPVPSALKPATEVVADWEGALHESQQRQVAAKAVVAEGADRMLTRLRPPAQDVKAWTYLSGGRPTEPFSFLELCAWLEAGKLDAYALVSAEQPLGDGSSAAEAGEGGEEEERGVNGSGPRWLLLAELIRMYGSQKRGDMPSAPPTLPMLAPMTAPPDPVFGFGGVQQPLSVPPGMVGMAPMAAMVGSAGAGGGGGGSLSLHHPGHRLLPGTSLPLSMPRPSPCPPPSLQQQQQPPLAPCGSMPLPCGPAAVWGAEGCGAVPPSTGGPPGGVGMGPTIHFPPLSTVRSYSELVKLPKPTASSASPATASEESGSPTSQQRPRSCSFSGHNQQPHGAALHRLGSSQQLQHQPHQQQPHQQQQKRTTWQPSPRSVSLQRSASPPLPPPPPLPPQHRAATPPLSRQDSQRPAEHMGTDMADCAGELPPRHTHHHLGKPPLRPGPHALGLPAPPVPPRPPPSHGDAIDSSGAPVAHATAIITAVADNTRRGVARPPSHQSSVTASIVPSTSRPSGPGTLPTEPPGPMPNAPPRNVNVNPALVSHAVRMTKLQFLERVRAHLPRVLSGMIEGAYCEYRLKMLDTQEQEDQQSVASGAAGAVDNTQSGLVTGTLVAAGGSDKQPVGAVRGEDGVSKSACASDANAAGALTGRPSEQQQQQQQGEHPVGISVVKCEQVEGEAQQPKGAPPPPPKQDAGSEGDVFLATEAVEREQDLKPVADGGVVVCSVAGPCAAAHGPAAGAPHSATTTTGPSGSPRGTGSRPRRSGRLNSPTTSPSGTKAITTTTTAGNTTTTTAGNTAAATTMPSSAVEAMRATDSPETLDLVESMTHDLFEEMLMLALFTVEAQREAVVRSTRSRRQAAAPPSTAAAAAWGGSMPAAVGAASSGGNKSRREAQNGASEEPTAAHPAKRQRHQAPRNGGTVAAWSRAADGDTGVEAGYAGIASRKAGSRDQSAPRRSEPGSEEGLTEAVRRESAPGNKGDVIVARSDGDAAAAAAKRQEGDGSEGDGGSGTVAGGEHEQVVTRPSKKSQHQARRPAKRARRESRSGGHSDDRVGSPVTGDEGGGGNHTLNEQAPESALEPNADGDGDCDADLVHDRPPDGDEAAATASPPRQPPPQRPPRHRGISAKELRSLAEGAAPEFAAVLAAAGGAAAAAAAGTSVETEAVHGGLVLGGDLQPLRGRRTRAAAAAAAVNAVAAIAAEALASMSDGPFCAASAALQTQRGDWEPASHARSNSRVFSQSEPQQLSPTRGFSDALGSTPAGDDDAEGLDSPFRALGAATGKRRSAGILAVCSSGAPYLARSHRSLDSLVTEPETASWQGGTAAGRHPSRRGSDSGRRPPSRTSSCTQEHLEGWHSALFPGKPYGKAMRNDSLTMLLEASLMAFGGGAATVTAAATTAVPDASPSAEAFAPMAVDAEVADAAVEPQVAADAEEPQEDAGGRDGGGDEFDGGAPSVPKHARGPRSARAGGMRRRSNVAVLAAVLEGHPAVIMTEGRRRRYPPPPGSSSAEAATTGAAQAVDTGSGEVGPDEEMPAQPWAEEVGDPSNATGGPYRTRRRRGSTTPPLPPTGDGAAVSAGPWVETSTRRTGPRASPLPAGDDTTTGAAVTTTSACQRTPTPMGMSEGGPSGCSDAAQQEQRISALERLEWDAGVSRGLPLHSMQALKLSHSSPPPPPAGVTGERGTVAASASVRNGAGGAGLGTASTWGVPPRARAAAIEHRFLTMAAAGGAAGALGGGGGRGGHASAEQQQGMEVAKWRLQAARAKKLKFGRSRIAGWGLFAVEPIEESEFVIEYCGELIRKPLDDVRQRKYDAAGYADYMFAVGDGLVIDATLAGNAARYINHCCDPNCEARVVEVGGERRIAIFALHRIEADEELHYDYKLSCMEGEERIPCGCGARNCKKFMN